MLTAWLAANSKVLTFRKPARVWSPQQRPLQQCNQSYLQDNQQHARVLDAETPSHTHARMATQLVQPEVCSMSFYIVHESACICHTICEPSCSKISWDLICVQQQTGDASAKEILQCCNLMGVVNSQTLSLYMVIVMDFKQLGSAYQSA